MRQKQADSIGSATPDPMVSAASAETVPKVQISNKPPAGQTGPRGLQPRQTYSRVNTGMPQTPDAGASGQKSMASRGLEFLPKLSEANMTTQVTPQPTINEMLKAAMDGTISRIDVTAEATRQLGTQTKVAAAATPESIPTDLLNKLADALGYIADELDKGAAIHLPGRASGEPAPGTGPGALHVTKSEVAGEAVLKPGGSGGKEVVHTGTEKGKHGPAPDNAMKTNESMHHGEQPIHPMGKSASDKLAASNLERMQKLALLPAPNMAAHAAALGKKTLPSLAGAGGIAAHFANKAAPAASGAGAGIAAQLGSKLAEDAINPAQISAGAAVPPDASESGEKTPTGPSGPTSLVSSNEAAINYTKHDAKSEPATEVGRLFTATPMKDPVLADVFAHSGQAGVKTSSALDATRVSAARALLSKVASEVADKAKKSKESAMGAGAPPPAGVPSPAFTQ